MSGQRVERPDAIWAYGCSYAVVRPGVRGHLHYLSRVARRLGGVPVHGFARNGTRIVDAVGAMLLDAALEGCNPPVPGAVWPGAALRPGVVVIDTLFNDIGHYPDGSVFPVVPAALADDRYVEGIATLTRAALALASSSEQVPVATATLTGRWDRSRVLGEADTAMASAEPGARAAFLVSPAQAGPLSGTVWLLGRSVDSAAGPPAALRVEVDGRDSGQRVLPPAWESYVGQTGDRVRGVVHCVAVPLPVDGRPHELALVHEGRPGEAGYVDAVVVPSERPGRVVVMGAETSPRAVLWTQEQVAVWAANRDRITARVRELVAEFPNARYAPSSIPARGISGRDGIHPNPRGMLHRARDLRRALAAAS